MGYKSSRFGVPGGFRVKSLGRLYKGYRGLSREGRKMSHTRAHTLGRVALTFTYSGFRGLKVQGLRV